MNYVANLIQSTIVHNIKKKNDPNYARMILRHSVNISDHKQSTKKGQNKYGNNKNY